MFRFASARFHLGLKRRNESCMTQLNFMAGFCVSVLTCDVGVCTNYEMLPWGFLLILKRTRTFASWVSKEFAPVLWCRTFGVETPNSLQHFRGTWRPEEAAPHTAALPDLAVVRSSSWCLVWEFEIVTCSSRRRFHTTSVCVPDPSRRV